MNAARDPHFPIHLAFATRYAAEAAQVIDEFEPERAAALLNGFGTEVAADVLSHMTPEPAARALAALPVEAAAAVLAELPLHVAATLAARLPAARRTEIVGHLTPAVATALDGFLAYPPEAAGSVMDPRVLAMADDLTVEAAQRQARGWPREDLHDVYVIDREHRLVGRVTVQVLLVAAPEARLADLMEREPLAVHPLDERERIVDLCNQRFMITVPVVDLDRRLLGIVRTREIFQAGQEDAGADMLTMVGASRDERALSPVLFSVRKRLPWLQINLLTAFLAAAVVGMFEDTIARFTALAVLLPVVAGQSGNTGSQALAVIMRGLALRDITTRDWMRAALKELGVAVVNGVAVAFTTSVAVYIWSGSLGLVTVISVSMIISMAMAGISGAVIPIILRTLNQDPAQSSSIVLTTVTDVVGFFSFLGLATVLSFMLV